jgi:multidrug transporter EmrE-like cation transporter
MGDQLVPALLYFIAGFFGAFGQYFYKIGGKRLGLISLWQNWQLLAGIVLFTGVMVLFVWAFKLGGRMNVVYPVYATTFIWGSLIGILVEKEPFTVPQLVCVVVVVLGTMGVAYFAPSSP